MVAIVCHLEIKNHKLLEKDILKHQFFFCGLNGGNNVPASDPILVRKVTVILEKKEKEIGSGIGIKFELYFL